MQETIQLLAIFFAWCIPAFAVGMMSYSGVYGGANKARTWASKARFFIPAWLIVIVALIGYLVWLVIGGARPSSGLVWWHGVLGYVWLLVGVVAGGVIADQRLHRAENRILQ